MSSLLSDPIIRQLLVTSDQQEEDLELYSYLFPNDPITQFLLLEADYEDYNFCNNFCPIDPNDDDWLDLPPLAKKLKMAVLQEQILNMQDIREHRKFRREMLLELREKKKLELREKKKLELREKKKGAAEQKNRAANKENRAAIGENRSRLYDVLLSLMDDLEEERRKDDPSQEKIDLAQKELTHIRKQYNRACQQCQEME